MGTAAAKGNDIYSNSILAQSGIRAAPALRSAGLLGVDAFQAACAATVAPEHMRIPPGAIRALTSANVNVYSLDRTPVAVMRYLGIRLYKLDAVRAIIPDKLREIYSRIKARRPKCCVYTPVIPTADAILCASIRHGVPLSTIDTILPLVTAELRLDAFGALIAPGPTRALRAVLACTSVAATVFVVTAFTVPYLFVAWWLGARNTSVVFSASRQVSLIVALVSVVVFSGTLFDEMVSVPSRGWIRSAPPLAAGAAVLLNALV